MAKAGKRGGGSRRSKPKSASETMPSAAIPEAAASGAAAPASATPAEPQPGGTGQAPSVSAQTKPGRPSQFSIPAELVEHILLGPIDDRRVLQDSPLLGDVWAAYALDPGIVQDVLITPHKKATAAVVAFLCGVISTS